MELSQLVTANVLQKAITAVEARVAAYGDPSEFHRRRLMGADAICRAAGVYEGQPLDMKSLAALDLMGAAMGILSAKDQLAAAADAIASVAYVARALGSEVSDTVFATVARAVGEQAETERSRSLAQRLRPVVTDPPAPGAA